jgi:hypothetical protein
VDGVRREPHTGEGQLVNRRDALAGRATLLFVGYFLTFAVICGAIIVRGWFAGVLDDPPERVFWLGAALAGVTLAVFAAAAFPGGPDDRREIARVTWTLRVGMLLAVLSPALCIGALIVDFYT